MNRKKAKQLILNYLNENKPEVKEETKICDHCGPICDCEYYENGGE